MQPDAADAASALDQIDTSSLDALEVVRGEEATVRELVQKAAERKGSVSKEVFSRVMGDYDGRLKSLEERARPLRAQARGEMAKLEALHGRLKSVFDAAALAHQEIEFRHDLGELKDEEFEARAQETKLAVASHQGAFNRAEALRQRFLELLPPQTMPAPSGSPEGEEREPAPQAVSSRAKGGERTPATSAKRLAVREPRSSEPKTLFVSGEPLAKDLPQKEEYGTVAVLQPPRLVEDVNGVPGTAHVVVTGATVGRTPDNQISIATPDVSRRHARIECRPDGSFVVIDLRSGNGTFVNGERIKERRLKDGDKVRFGNRSFVFHNA
jgi:FHA domain